MAASRIALAVAVVVGVAGHALARPPCRLAQVVVPTCLGVGTASSARLCFGDACALPGTVFGIGPPDLPFQPTGMHVDGALGSRPVTDADFPVQLASGEAFVVDLVVFATAVGDTHSRVSWFVGSFVDEVVQVNEEGDGGNKQTGTCTTDVVASVPVCGADPSRPCAQSACSAGACAPVVVTGPCADRCQTGGTCVGDACVGGTPIDCADANACTLDACDPAVGCVHTPVDAACDDHDPCTTDNCDPARGCVHGPRFGPCDDGNACTTDDRCRNGVCVGEPVRCSDPFACTEDACVDGRCTFVPVDARCDAGECGKASCSPDDPAADRRGCVVAAGGEGEACTDDGWSCTDDVCTDGGCLHVPVDARCGSPDSCTARVCAPERRDADAAGCAPAEAPRDGGTCAEDGDPCSTDTCRGGVCEHARIAAWNTCTPVQGAFRRALGLVSLARSLHSTVSTAAGARAGSPGGMNGLVSSLSGVEADLQQAVDTLAGRGGTADEAGVAETPAQTRARLASAGLVRTPASVRAFLGRLRARQARTVLGADDWRGCRRRAVVLLHGTKSLKAELQRLQQVSRTFAR